MQAKGSLQVRGDLLDRYRDVLTPAALDAMAALEHFDADRRQLMQARIERRTRRARERERISFLPPDSTIGRTTIRVSDARAGRFDGSDIPADLQRQWIQGTGPAARPRATTRESIRNVAYALLSGADGWMFDGEDALGQVDSMSLDNQRNLRLAFARDAAFMAVAEQVASEMNAWAQRFFGRRTIEDWRTQLDFTTRIFRARGLHLDDRHIRRANGHACPRPSSMRSCISSTITRSFGAKGGASCSTCRRSRRPKKRRCGMTSLAPSSAISACRTA